MELNTEDYANLLNIFMQLKKSNKEKIELGINDYSLINALLKVNNEVQLHSNFIFSMINPNSNHYVGNIFLQLFLEAINELNFLSLNECRVHKEKGKIDLLIEDGNRVLIIENKLRAGDQKYQISRYIQYAIETYLGSDSKNLYEKIHVVYLSEYKEKPSQASQSIIGFEFNSDNNLVWKNQKVNIKLDLEQNTLLKFNRVRHSYHLKQWTKSCINWLNQNRQIGNNLAYAFDEYRQILNRLDRTKQWRKLMELDDYILGMSEVEERKMYQFMFESKNKFNTYSGKKFFKKVISLFEEKNISIDNARYQEFTEINCINWFKQKGLKENWKDIGFQFQVQNKIYILVLGIDHLYLGEDNANLITSINRIRNIRKSNIFSILTEINQKIEKF